MLPKNGNTLVITGPDPNPVQILTDRHDLHTTHEQADIVIIQQAVHLAPTGINSIRVVADDTYNDICLCCCCIITPPSS